jgi:hypothetical protein
LRRPAAASAQQPIVAIEHGDGEGLSASQRERRHALPNDHDRDAGCQQKEHRDEEGSPQDGGLPAQSTSPAQHLRLSR